MGIPKHVRRVIKIVVGLALFAVVGIAALLRVLWLDHTRETALPTPTGPFAVGRTTYVWSDAAHADPMAPQPDTNRSTKRDLLAWIWYPAAPQRLSQTIDDYLSGSLADGSSTPDWPGDYAVRDARSVTGPRT